MNCVLINIYDNSAVHKCLRLIRTAIVINFQGRQLMQLSNFFSSSMVDSGVVKCNHRLLRVVSGRCDKKMCGNTLHIMDRFGSVASDVSISSKYDDAHVNGNQLQLCFNKKSFSLAAILARGVHKDEAV